MENPQALSYERQKAAILADPSTSFVLADRVRRDCLRDPVDALHDAQALLDLQQARVNELLGPGAIRAGL